MDVEKRKEFIGQGANDESFAQDSSKSRLPIVPKKRKIVRKILLISMAVVFVLCIAAIGYLGFFVKRTAENKFPVFMEFPKAASKESKELKRQADDFLAKAEDLSRKIESEIIKISHSVKELDSVKKMAEEGLGLANEAKSRYISCLQKENKNGYRIGRFPASVQEEIRQKSLKLASEYEGRFLGAISQIDFRRREPNTNVLYQLLDEKEEEQSPDELPEEPNLLPSKENQPEVPKDEGNVPQELQPPVEPQPPILEPPLKEKSANEPPFQELQPVEPPKEEEKPPALLEKSQEELLLEEADNNVIKVSTIFDQDICKYLDNPPSQENEVNALLQKIDEVKVLLSKSKENYQNIYQLHKDEKGYAEFQDDIKRIEKIEKYLSLITERLKITNVKGNAQKNPPPLPQKEPPVLPEAEKKPENPPLPPEKDFTSLLDELKQIYQKTQDLEKAVEKLREEYASSPREELKKRYLEEINELINTLQQGVAKSVDIVNQGGEDKIPAEMNLQNFENKIKVWKDEREKLQKPNPPKTEEPNEKEE